MKQPFASLRRKVSRRVFATVTLCAVFPITGLVALTLYSADKELTTMSERRLSHACKSIGMVIMMELNSLHSSLRDKAKTLGLDQTDLQMFNSGSSHNSEDPFLKVWFFKNEKTPAELPPITGAMKQHLRKGQPYLSVVKSSAEPIILLWSQALDRNNRTGFIVAQLNPSHLWAYFQGFLPIGAALTIVDGDLDPLLTQGAWQTDLKEHLSNQDNRYFEIEDRDEQWLVSHLNLLLQAKFQSPDWHILVKESKSYAYANLIDYKRNSLLVASIALWIILLTCSILIRKILTPLENLKLATKAVGLGHYDFDLKVNSNDEFRVLAESFNGMVSKIQSQINRQKGMQRAVREVLGAEGEERIIEQYFSGIAAITSMDIACLTLFKSNISGTEKTGSTWINKAGRSRIDIIWGTEVSQTEMRKLAAEEGMFTYAVADEYPVLFTPLQSSITRHHFIFYFHINQATDAVVVLADREFVPDSEILTNTRQLTDQLSVALSRAATEKELFALNTGALTALARTVDANSKWTHGHSERVTQYALVIARALGLSEKECDDIHHACLLHDLGKVSIPTEILNKSSRLTDQEYELIKSHPVQADQIIEPIKAFSGLRKIVRQHHERWDGNGYPDGIAGEKIHLGARILAVADVYDALYSDRPYREGWPQEKVIDFLKKESGRMFDPKIVSALLQNLHKLAN